MATVTFYNVSSEAPFFNSWIDFKIFIKTSHAGFPPKKNASPVEMRCVSFHVFHFLRDKFTSSSAVYTFFVEPHDLFSQRFQQNNLLNPTLAPPTKNMTSKIPHELPLFLYPPPNAGNPQLTSCN